MSTDITKLGLQRTIDRQQPIVNAAREWSRTRSKLTDSTSPGADYRDYVSAIEGLTKAVEEAA